MARMVMPRNTALRLGGQDSNDVSFLESVSGGAITAAVLNDPAGPQHNVKRHIGPLEIEDFSVQVGITTSSGLFDWIAASWDQAPKKDGAVLTIDQNFAVKSERAFTGALIAETTIPAFDGASKDAGVLTVRFTPEFIALEKSTGDVPMWPLGRQKLWRSACFRLEIKGLDCSRVNRIEPFTVKRAISFGPVEAGGARRIEAGDISFPNLQISLAEATSESWLAWYEDFVIKGRNNDAFERNGFVSILTPDLLKEVARIELNNLGIFRLLPKNGDKRADNQIARVTAHLYCERMSLSFPLSKT